MYKKNWNGTKLILYKITTEIAMMSLKTKLTYICLSVSYTYIDWILNPRPHHPLSSYKERMCNLLELIGALRTNIQAGLEHKEPPQSWSSLLSRILHRFDTLICPCQEWLVLESRLKPCLQSLSFLRASWHGAKNSCLRASSALILNLGFTVKHLSTRSRSDLGITSRNSGLFVFASHQSLSFVDGNDCVS